MGIFERAIEFAEPAVEQALKDHGLIVGGWGQAMITDAVRDMMRGRRQPDRWMPDFRVCRKPITGTPHWPADRRGQFTFLVDAKFRHADQRNYSIQMLPLLFAKHLSLPVFYVVCTLHDDNTCTDFQVISHDNIAFADYYAATPCCDSCWQAFTGPDPAKDIPDRCPGQKVTSRSSGTPYVLIRPSFVKPLTQDVFDVYAMAKDVRGRPAFDPKNSLV